MVSWEFKELQLAWESHVPGELGRPLLLYVTWIPLSRTQNRYSCSLEDKTVKFQVTPWNSFIVYVFVYQMEYIWYKMHFFFGFKYHINLKYITKLR